MAIKVPKYMEKKCVAGEEMRCQVFVLYKKAEEEKPTGNLRQQ